MTHLSFVLPAAECDFHMNSTDKGWMNAAPVVGMIVSSCFWGLLADSKGRRYALIVALLIHAVTGLISSVTPYFIVFLVLRAFNGFAIAGLIGIIFPYIGEFQPTSHREKVLCYMELFWSLGVVLMPAIAWGIIPLSINIEYPFFLYKSWSLYVTACSLPSFVLLLWLVKLPETPKYLIEVGEYSEALEVFQEIFISNKKMTIADYPIKSLRRKSVINVAHIQLPEAQTKTEKPKSKISVLVDDLKKQTKAMFGRKHGPNILITCLIQFGLFCSYYGIMFWLPELFNRYKNFELTHPGHKASVCDVSSSPLSNNYQAELQQPCNGDVKTEAFVNTLIIGLVCVPFSVIMPWCVEKIGAKWFLVLNLVLAGGVTLSLILVETSTENLIVSCLFETFTALSVGVLLTILVDLFPTNLRVMAGCLSSTCGRIGGLFGNLIFGFMIDQNCIALICIMAGMLLGAALFSLLLPSTGKQELD